MNFLLRKLIDVKDRNPNHLAVVEDDWSVTYSQFVEIVYLMASAFVPILEKSESKCIAIAMEKGVYAYAAQFATLMSGGFYLPIDLKSPDNRISQILQSVVPAILLSDISFENFLHSKTQLLTTSDLRQGREVRSMPAHHLAYLKFTSGSTGQPKGVMVNQNAVINYLDWVLRSFNPKPDDNWSQHPNISFDASVTDIFGALTSGATLYPIQSNMDLIFPGEWIKKNKISIWNSVPSAFDAMFKTNQVNTENLSTVRLFNFCGETLYSPQVENLFVAVPNAEIQNTYGPTEATVACKAIKFKAKDFNDYNHTSVEIGNDIPGVRTYVDNDELLISGIQLADGYWLNDRATAESFFIREFESKHIRLYSTGDLVRINDCGKTFFVERKDQQVKIRGHRVELGEVITALRKMGHSECCAAVVDDAIVAFICDQDFDEVKIFSLLKKALHPAAIPSKFVYVEKIPRTQNFKIDTQELIRWYKENHK